MSPAKTAEECFQALKEHYQAIPEEMVERLTMPPEEVVAEGEQLSIVAREDAAVLESRKMPLALIDQLTLAVGGFAFAEGSLEASVEKDSEMTRAWNDYHPEGFVLRRDLIDEFGFAYEFEHTILKALDEIKEGQGHKDAILDLLALEILGRRNPEPLEAINFDFSQLDRAKELHAILSGAYAAAMLDDEVDEARAIRDRAFTYLNDIMEQIRRYGRFVYRKDPKRAALYKSNYYQALGRAGGSSRNREPVTDTAETMLN